MSATITSAIGPSGQTLVLVARDGSASLTTITALVDPVVTLSGPGSGAVVRVTGWDAAGGIASLTVVNAGSNYDGTTTASAAGGLGTGFTPGAVTLNGNGGILSIAIGSAGTGYGPTYSVDGGPANGLAYPIWGQNSGHDTSGPYACFVLFPLSGTISPASVVTVTLPDGWITTAAGTITGVASTAAANLVGKTFLPPFDASSPKTMGVGWNIVYITYFQVENFYANAARQSNSVANPGTLGYPQGPFPATATVSQMGTDGADPLGYPVYPADGTWTLMWDGLYSANLKLLALAGTVTLLTDTPGTNSTNNTRTYRLQAPPSLHAPQMQIQFGAAGATNVRLYPPGEPTDGSELFGQNVIRQAGPAQCCRFMLAFVTSPSLVVDYTDFGDPSNINVFTRDPAVCTLPGAAVASFDPWTPPDAWVEDGWAAFQITTTTPHHAKTGQVLLVTGPATPSGSPDVPLTNGGTMYSFTLAPFVARVLDDHHIGTQRRCSPSGTGPGTLTQSYPQPAGVQIGPNGNADVLPPIDAVKFCNRIGSDVWMNVPHAATPDCIAELAAMVAATLPTGRKCYLEYSNEHWNSNAAYEQWQYFRMLRRTMPGSGATATAVVSGSGNVTGFTGLVQGTGYQIAPAVTIAPPTSGGTATAHATLINGVLNLVLDSGGSGYSAASPPAVTITAAPGHSDQEGGSMVYAWKAAAAHAAFVAAFQAAGRPTSDVVRILGSQMLGTNVTQYLVNAASWNGIAFDALAVAPYFSCNMGHSEPYLAAAYNQLTTPEMCHDLLQQVMLAGIPQSRLTPHRTILNAAGLTSVKLVGYEGGLQTGTPGTVNTLQLTRAWARHPRMHEAQLYFLQIHQDAGMSLLMDFDLFGPQTGSQVENWSKFQGRAMRAGLGDCSDGLFDNRTNYYDLSQVVSVQGHAINVWQGLVRGSPATPHRQRALPDARRRHRLWI